MNGIKKLLMGLPMFNFFVVALLFALATLEMHFNPVTEYSAPIALFGVIWILLLEGGFVVCGLVFGARKTIKYNYGWGEIVTQIIILTIIIKCMYIVFYLLILNDHTFIIRDTSIITLEQMSGYAAGCGIGKLINNFD